MNETERALTPLIYRSEPTPGPGRPKGVNPPIPKRVLMKNKRIRDEQDRCEHLAVLDFETDPFDEHKRENIFPFTACLYSPNFPTTIIWDENPTTFIDKVIHAIENLPHRYTIYAHNGGKFDFQFFLYRLRGEVSFKGRGLMLARVGMHELRDSFHIIPEKLAAYRKDAFDYTKLTKTRRNKHREEIIQYMTADCVYLYEIVDAFVKNYGLKLSIGQAAMAKLKEANCHVERISEQSDAFLRNYYFGGRVECISGLGHRVASRQPFRLYDVNSMYPFAMAEFEHPISARFDVRVGAPSAKTCFIDLECTNIGALIARNENGETTASIPRGRFRTTIWEYETALRHGLIKDVKINWCLDYEERANFSSFVVPLYENRLATKALLSRLAQENLQDTKEFIEAKKDDIFFKLLLNNSYGKFAQNPRRFKENYITAFGERPPEDQMGFGAMPDVENEALCYAIWSRPLEKLRFHNVATAASITGAARAILLDAIMKSRNPIYCDTDSLICEELIGTSIHKTKLGAWDIEKEISEIIVLGKKLYAYKDAHTGKVTCRQKGTSGGTWEQFQAMLEGQTITFKAHAPTLTRGGNQVYIDRNVRATAAPPNVALLKFISTLERLQHGRQI